VIWGTRALDLPRVIKWQMESLLKKDWIGP